MATHTQTKDLKKTWSINTSNDHWILAKNASIDATAQPAIILGPDLDNNTITIRGDITARRIANAIDIGAEQTGILIMRTSEINAKAGVGINVTEADAVIKNSGELHAKTKGIMSSEHVTIENHGVIDAKSIGVHAAGVMLDNFGTITGINGLQTGAQLGMVVSDITNHKGGLIEGDAYGVFITGTGSYLLENHGTISGKTSAIIAASGSAASIHNDGLIKGDVHLGAQADLFDTVGGKVKGQIFGGAGDDTYIVDKQSFKIVELDGEGSRDEVQSAVSYTIGENIEILTLLGNANVSGTGNGLDNQVYGNDGNNLLKGLAGDDILEGGAGTDTLTGGTGMDYFGFELGTGKDTITDFTDGEDLIFSSYALDEDDIASLLADHVTEKDGNLVISYGADELTIVGLAKANLTEDDFIVLL